LDKHEYRVNASIQSSMIGRDDREGRKEVRGTGGTYTFIPAASFPRGVVPELGDIYSRIFLEFSNLEFSWSFRFAVPFPIYNFTLLRFFGSNFPRVFGFTIFVFSFSAIYDCTFRLRSFLRISSLGNCKIFATMT
jgi:hypothetical protein